MKAGVLKACNVALYLATCLLSATGLLLELRLDGRRSAVLGIGREEWGEFHLVVALVFAGLSILHMVLNWNWIVGMLRGKMRWPMILVGVLGVAIVGGLLLAPGSGGGHESQGREVHDDD
jgi:hypothetical protein